MHSAIPLTDCRRRPLSGQFHRENGRETGTGWDSREGFGLFAEGDLASRAEVLDVDTIGEVGLVPFNLSQECFCSEGMECSHLAASRCNLTAVYQCTMCKKRWRVLLP